MSTSSQAQEPSVSRDFSDFVETHQTRLIQALVASVGPQLASEALSEAWLYAWRTWPKVAGLAQPVAYLRRVGLDRVRHRRKALLLDPVEPEAPREPDVDLAMALRQLPEKQRAVVFLVEGCGWSSTAAADLLGISRSSVRVHLRRGLASLRKSLESDA
jgi:RNA polymerase sigma factor (sigma-70 family)